MQQMNMDEKEFSDRIAKTFGKRWYDLSPQEYEDIRKIWSDIEEDFESACDDAREEGYDDGFSDGQEND